MQPQQHHQPQYAVQGHPSSAMSLSITPQAPTPMYVPNSNTGTGKKLLYQLTMLLSGLAVLAAVIMLIVTIVNLVQTSETNCCPWVKRVGFVNVPESAARVACQVARPGDEFCPDVWKRVYTNGGVTLGMIVLSCILCCVANAFRPPTGGGVVMQHHYAAQPAVSFMSPVPTGYPHSGVMMVPQAAPSTSTLTAPQSMPSAAEASSQGSVARVSLAPAIHVTPNPVASGASDAASRL